MRICELKEKEVINVCSGRRLGCIADVEINICTGEIEAIVIPARENMRIFRDRL